MTRVKNTHGQPPDLIGGFVQRITQGDTLWRAYKAAGFEGTPADAMRLLESEAVRNRFTELAGFVTEAKVRDNIDELFEEHHNLRQLALQRGRLGTALKAAEAAIRLEVLRAGRGAATDVTINEMTRDQLLALIGEAGE